MRPKLQFYVVGLPTGQPRAKATRFGGHTRMYTPTTIKTPGGIRREHPAAAFKSIVRCVADDAWMKSGIKEPWTGALCVNLTFYFPRPKAHYRTNGQLKPKAPKWHTGKPDRDNCDKLILDAITQTGLWMDDKQVCDGRIRKFYLDGTRPAGCEVEIAEAGE